MPCRDYFNEKSLSKTQSDNFRSDIQDLQKRNNELAVFLCEACKTITDNKLRDKMSKELQNWYWHHSKADRKRKK